MLVIDLVAFGWWGLLVWGIQMIWVPFFAAGVINGLAHWWGYRNTATADTSTNLIPWGVWIGGEELHNNHHADGASARFSKKWWEFDIGWMYICILQALGLAKLREKN
jgi:stearoyl-CoA desaturase (delta-9 desaturase)